MKNNDANDVQRFNLEIKDFKERTFQIEVKKNIPKFNYNDTFFDNFNLDLLYFIIGSGYNPRWDIGTVYLHKLENLKLEKEQLKEFIEKLYVVTNWNIREGKNENL